MNPCRSQLDAPESGFKQGLQHDETGMGIHTADVHGVAPSVGRICYTAHGLVVLGAAVCRRQGKRNARNVPRLVEHLEQIGVHLFDASPAPTFATELGRGEVT